MTFSDDSGSDTSSERSLSPSPPTFSYSSFANPIRIPLKSQLSPPSTTSSDFALSPKTPPPSSISPHTVICAYPSWPAGNFLTAQPSTFSHITGAYPSSRISDEDLLSLEDLDLCGDVRVAKDKWQSAPPISWEATKQPPVVVFSAPKRPIISAKRKRRRSSGPQRRRSMKAMSPIPEMPEQ
ncbi:MAG: hypothetical protein Q9174_002753 [Haloplaca sp. 1 TL-2023]